MIPKENCFFFTFQETWALKFHTAMILSKKLVPYVRAAQQKLHRNPGQTQTWHWLTEAFFFLSQQGRLYHVSWLFSSATVYFPWVNTGHLAHSLILESPSVSVMTGKERRSQHTLLACMQIILLFIAFCDALNWILLVIKILFLNAYTNALHVNSICINAVSKQQLVILLLLCCSPRLNSSGDCSPFLPEMEGRWGYTVLYLHAHVQTVSTGRNKSPTPLLHSPSKNEPNHAELTELQYVHWTDTTRPVV